MNAIGSVLLDTSVVVDYLRSKDQNLIGKMEAVNELYLPLIALGELLYGGYKAHDKERTLADVRKFLSACTILFPDETTADFMGR
jgi:tRNA(fMet)-specific endonuclease VapC